MTAKPLILTCGDPAGIGPEITVGAWKLLGRDMPVVVAGDPGQISAIAVSAEVPSVVVTQPEQAGTRALSILPLRFAETPQAGMPSLANAVAVVEGIELAVGLVRSGRCAALVTNPVSKAVLKQGAGFAFPGHTEFLAHLDGGAQPVMMLAGPELRVVPVTVHIPLSAVPGALTAALLESTLRITDAELRQRFGLAEPRLAVAGLNPHAGESGTMGDEEQKVIIPVLDRLRAEGMNLRGPLAADSLFHPAARATYDAAICMYHDQALIPLKTLSFSEGVNVTLGLSFIRTSPDHGTAFDIAGKGIADPSSLIAAMRMAWQMANGLPA